MRFLRTPSSLLSLLYTILSCAHISQGSPVPYEAIQDQQNNTLELRQYNGNCGYSSQLTCTWAQSCYTVAGEASCGPAATAAVATQAYGDGQWEYYTMTYTETDLVTVVTTFSSFIPATTTQYVAPPVQTQVIVTTVIAPAPVQTNVCNSNLGEVYCGAGLCCGSGQFCANNGVSSVCSAYGGSTPGVSTYYVTPTASSDSAFIRPTSDTVQTVTSTGTATETVPFETPIGTDGSSLTGITATQQSTGLSGGAIAGIVIGVLVLLFLLFLFCACCLAKGIFDGIRDIFGLGKKRRVTDTTIIEERRSRHGSRVQGGGRTWYGRSNDQQVQKKSSGWGGALGVGAALAGLAMILGLKRRNDKKDEKMSYGAGSSYTYSDSYTSESSASSDDRRTRNSRRDSRRGSVRR